MMAFWGQTEKGQKSIAKCAGSSKNHNEILVFSLFLQSLHQADIEKVQNIINLFWYFTAIETYRVLQVCSVGGQIHCIHYFC